MPEYLFEYHHNSEQWSISIWAEDRKDAQARMNKLPLARYVGEVHMKIPARLGWVAKAYCAIRNFFRATS